MRRANVLTGRAWTTCGISRRWSMSLIISAPESSRAALKDEEQSVPGSLQGMPIRFAPQEVYDT